jgi:hypothetical protein
MLVSNVYQRPCAGTVTLAGQRCVPLTTAPLAASTCTAVGCCRVIVQWVSSWNSPDLTRLQHFYKLTGTGFLFKTWLKVAINFSLISSKGKLWEPLEKFVHPFSYRKIRDLEWKSGIRILGEIISELPHCQRWRWTNATYDQTILGKAGKPVLSTVLLQLLAGQLFFTFSKFV